MGSAAGVIKIAAKRCGLPLDAYVAKIAAGEKRCTACKQWKLVDEFGLDSHRGDGRAASCLTCREVRYRETYVRRPRNRYGPLPRTPRDGDKVQARQRINVEVRTGKRPHPNTLPCADCGHVWSKGQRRHEYDHYLGYAAEHHYDVESVCTTCHSRRDNAKATQTHCKHGHELTPENIYRKSNGNRACRQCMKRWDKLREPRGSAHWKRVNSKRRGRNG